MKILDVEMVRYAMYTAIEDCESGECYILVHYFDDKGKVRVSDSKCIMQGLTEAEALEEIAFYRRAE